jgi:hypothetical protein
VTLVEGKVTPPTEKASNISTAIGKTKHAKK